ncbi:MAG: hypothetical protein HOW73_34475 [Polyangiaceae bacterium]|nr:hypothetical protein [Polyangiaceae bacterium]
MKTALKLGPDVVMRLLPHRRPFLMIDNVEAYERGKRPTLWSSRHVSANEPVFEGHFPEMSVWPGVYTIEGMGQSTNVLAILHFVELGMVERGLAPDRLLEGLRNLELRTRFHPGYRPEVQTELETIMKTALPSPTSALGMSAAVDVKLLAPVFAGQRIDFTVSLTHAMDRLLRFEVRAEVDGREVARGVMKGAYGFEPRSAIATGD